MIILYFKDYLQSAQKLLQVHMFLVKDFLQVPHEIENLVEFVFIYRKIFIPVSNKVFVAIT
jgi:hypothetical protein